MSNADASWLSQRLRALRVAASVVALVLVPVLFYGSYFVLQRGDVGFDTRLAYVPAARFLLDGSSPYPALDSLELLQQHAFVYPPLLAELVAPLAVFTDSTAAFVASLSLVLAVVGTLLLVGVRDWRCFGAAFLWAPTFNAIDNANVSLLVALALAAAWRLRSRSTMAGGLLGLAVAVKMFAWPLLVWPLVAARGRMAIVAAGTTVLAIVGSWAVIGFEGLTGYPRLVHRLTELEEANSYSVSAAVTTLGASESIAATFAIASVALLLGLALVRARRDDELGALTACVAAALVATPILWQHYLVLLLVPLGIARPRFSLMWLVPCVLWAADLQGDNGALWQTLLVPTVAAGLIIEILRADSRSDREKPRFLTGSAAA